MFFCCGRPQFLTVRGTSFTVYFRLCIITSELTVPIGLWGSRGIVIPLYRYVVLGGTSERSPRLFLSGLFLAAGFFVVRLKVQERKK